MTPHPPTCRNGVDPPAGLRLGPQRGRRPAGLAVLNGLTVLALLASLASLAACSASLLPKPPPPPTRFTLDAQAAASAPREAPAGAPASAPAAAPALVVVVAVPRAASGFDSARMVYLRQPQQLEAFAFHEWVDTPARMLAPR